MKRMENLLSAGIVMALAMAVSVPAALGQDSPAGVIQYRQKVMGALSGHLGGSGQILKHKLSFKNHIAGHARAVADLAKLLPDLFPANTEDGNTDALPDIWKDKAKFEKAARNLEKQAGMLARVAVSGGRGEIGAQLKKTGKACGGCHKKFRQPKEKRYRWKKK